MIASCQSTASPGAASGHAKTTARRHASAASRGAGRRSRRKRNKNPFFNESARREGSSRSRFGRCFEERLRKANRNAKVRAAKTSDHGKRDSDDLPILVDERPAGAAGSCLRIVNNL